MQLVRQTIEASEAELPEVELVADRFKLQKRRWRGEASDGADFGFELAEPLGHGAVFFESATHRYHIRQTPESVLAIRLAGNATEAAETGWQIGNLHMPVQVAAGEIRVGDDANGKIGRQTRGKGALGHVTSNDHPKFTLRTQYFRGFLGTL